MEVTLTGEEFKAIRAREKKIINLFKLLWGECWAQGITGETIIDIEKQMKKLHIDVYMRRGSK